MHIKSFTLKIQSKSHSYPVVLNHFYSTSADVNKQKKQMKMMCNNGISGNVACVSSGSYCTLAAGGQSQWCEVQKTTHTHTEQNIFVEVFSFQGV